MNKKILFCTIICIFFSSPLLFAQMRFPMAERKARIPKPKSNFSTPKMNKPQFGKPQFGKPQVPPFMKKNKPPFQNNSLPFDPKNLKMPSIPVDNIFKQFPKGFRNQLKKELSKMKVPDVENMIKGMFRTGAKPPIDPKFWEGLIYSTIVSKAMFLKGDLRKNNILADLSGEVNKIGVDPKALNYIISEYAKLQNLPAEYEDIMKTILEQGYGVTNDADDDKSYSNSDSDSGENSSNQLCNYFFKQGEYTLYNTSPLKKVTGPNNINTDWSGLWSDSIDASINWGDGFVYFFKGSQWMRFNSRTKVKDQGPSSIRDFWPDLWPDGIDAAVNWGNGYAFFFKGDKVIRYTINPRQKDIGPVQIKKLFSGLPSTGIDAALNYNNEYVYFFKNKYAIRFKTDTAKKTGDTLINKKWSGLWSRDIDAATFCSSSQ